MVARLLLDSVSLAQKPKSARFLLAIENNVIRQEAITHTDLHITSTVQQNVVTLDIAVDDGLAV